MYSFGKKPPPEPATATFLQAIVAKKQQAVNPPAPPVPPAHASPAVSQPPTQQYPAPPTQQYPAPPPQQCPAPAPAGQPRRASIWDGLGEAEIFERRSGRDRLYVLVEELKAEYEKRANALIHTLAEKREVAEPDAAEAVELDALRQKIEFLLPVLRPAQPDEAAEWGRQNAKGSPIEALFLLAFMELPGTTFSVEREGFVSADGYLLLAQVPMLDGRYVVDFLLMAVDDEWGIVVECDGHDSHSTKEQLEADHDRDHELRLIGYGTRRFTGSALTKSAAACVEKALELANHLAEGK